VLGSIGKAPPRARLAFGATRILLVDKTPVLMQEGDLVILGPQRHGVPSMPDVEEALQQHTQTHQLAIGKPNKQTSTQTLMMCIATYIHISLPLSLYMYLSLSL